MIVIIIMLISVAICLYKKIISQAEIRKAEIPVGLEQHPELDSHGFEDQYVPNNMYNKKVTEKGNKEFGGVGIKRKGAKGKSTGLDDLVFQSRTPNKMLEGTFDAESHQNTVAKLNDTEGALVGDSSHSSLPIPDVEIAEGKLSPMRELELELAKEK